MTGPRPWPAPLPECICTICNRKLDVREIAGIPYYAHALADIDDHEPAPIPEPENWTGGRCDFCAADEMKFRIPCHDFIAPGDEGYISEGAWSACTKCGALIAADKWDELLDYVMADIRARHPEINFDGLATNLAQMYRQLRANMIGGIEAIGASQ